MHIREIFPDVITEDLDYEYKQILNPDNPVKWAKTIVGYANGKGGVMFVGVSNEGEAFGIRLEEIDKTKNLIAKINDRHIFPHARVQYNGCGYYISRWKAKVTDSTHQNKIVIDLKILFRRLQKCRRFYYTNEGHPCRWNGCDRRSKENGKMVD